MSYRRLLVPVDGSELTDKAIHASISHEHDRLLQQAGLD